MSRETTMCDLQIPADPTPQSDPSAARTLPTPITRSAANI